MKYSSGVENYFLLAPCVCIIRKLEKNSLLSGWSPLQAYAGPTLLDVVNRNGIVTYTHGARTAFVVYCFSINLHLLGKLQIVI